MEFLGSTRRNKYYKIININNLIREKKLKKIMNNE